MPLPSHERYVGAARTAWAVAANLAGASLPGIIQVRKRKRERVDFGEWQRRAREGR
ncbi:MAG TPA: hypothetical protein VM223_15890 [Planctomycetota bacterium]|nr:hypothetical protein [Planctomycetota bacterium]